MKSALFMALSLALMTASALVAMATGLDKLDCLAGSVLCLTLVVLAFLAACGADRAEAGAWHRTYPEARGHAVRN